MNGNVQTMIDNIFMDGHIVQIVDLMIDLLSDSLTTIGMVRLTCHQLIIQSYYDHVIHYSLCNHPNTLPISWLTTST